MHTSCDSKTPSLKKEFLSRIADSFVCALVFPPKALMNLSAGRSFHFNFLIFRFLFLIRIYLQSLLLLVSGNLDNVGHFFLDNGFNGFVVGRFDILFQCSE